MLAELGYGAGGLAAELAAAAPNDLVFALEGEQAAVEAVATDPDAWLARGSGGAGAAGIGAAEGSEPRSLQESLERRPDASVAVISVPGHYAAREAREAIALGLNVFLFSSNVSVEDELSLKEQARDKGLIVMGPDCGTAYVGGAGIGFANAVRRGPIGVVGSTGTGMQEFASLVHRAGSGISHGIGTGSRDLSDAVGGISTLTALDALEKDPGTKVIAVLSKPAGTQTTARLGARLAGCKKPVVFCVLGLQEAPASAPGSAQGGGFRFASTIDEAVTRALEAAGARPASALEWDTAAMRAAAAKEVAAMSPAQKYLRGVFAGGTFCYQSQAIFSAAGLSVYSNSPLPGMKPLADPRVSRENSMVDMGAEIFVEGRPHPMIDAALRRERIAVEGRDPAVAILLLDFILGAISSADPVGDLIGAITEAKAAAGGRGGHLCVVASVCGTNDDAQGLEAQSGMLRDAGVLVFASNAQAALFSREAALLAAMRKGNG